MTKHLKGIFLCLVLTVSSAGLATLLPALGTITYCLILGALLRTFLNLKADWKIGIDFCAKTVLAYAVILLGFHLKISFLLELGPSLLGALIGVVAISITASFLFHKILKIDRETSLLIGIGSGICGASAIAACSRMITEDEAKVGTALGVLHFVGILGLILFPIVAVTLHLTLFQSSLLLGGTLQSLGHVAAAAGTLGAATLNMAIAIKMGRVFLLLPTVVTLHFLFEKSKRHWLQKIPFYLWGFMAAVLLSHLPITPDLLIEAGSTIGKWLLMTAMVGIGFGIDLKTFFKQAPKLTLLAVLIQSLQILILICLFFGDLPSREAALRGEAPTALPLEWRREAPIMDNFQLNRRG